jgi:hypothetical protein
MLQLKKKKKKKKKKSRQEKRRRMMLWIRLRALGTMGGPFGRQSQTPSVSAHNGRSIVGVRTPDMLCNRWRRDGELFYILNCLNTGRISVVTPFCFVLLF